MTVAARLWPTWRTSPSTDIRMTFLLPRVWDLRNNLTAYDAVYVALAEALDAPLLTRDRRLAAQPVIMLGLNGRESGLSQRWPI